MTRSFLSIRQVCERISLHRTSIYERIKKGEFPSSIKVGPNRVAWVSEEIDDWIEGRIVESRGKGDDNA